MKVEKWTDFLSEDCYNRLCDCKTQKSDVQALVNAKWEMYQLQGKDKKGFAKEDALIAVLELLDENSCCFDFTQDEYNELKR